MHERCLPEVIVPYKHFDVIAHFVPVEAEHKMLCGQPESSMKPHLSSRVDLPQLTCPTSRFNSSVSSTSTIVHNSER